MLALFLDIVGAGLVSVYVDKRWLQVVCAVLVGVASPIASNMLAYVSSPDTFTAGETLVRIVGGMIWHPLVAVVALLVLRKKPTTNNVGGKNE